MFNEGTVTLAARNASPDSPVTRPVITTDSCAIASVGRKLSPSATRRYLSSLLGLWIMVRTPQKRLRLTARNSSAPWLEGAQNRVPPLGKGDSRQWKANWSESVSGAIQQRESQQRENTPAPRVLKPIHYVSHVRRSNASPSGVFSNGCHRAICYVRESNPPGRTRKRVCVSKLDWAANGGFRPRLSSAGPQCHRCKQPRAANATRGCSFLSGRQRRRPVYS